MVLVREPWRNRVEESNEGGGGGASFPSPKGICLRFFPLNFAREQIGEMVLNG